MEGREEKGREGKREEKRREEKREERREMREYSKEMRGRGDIEEECRKYRREEG